MNETSHAARSGRSRRLALFLAAIVALGVASPFFYRNPLLHQRIEKGDPAYVEALASNGKPGYVKKADLG